MTLETHRLQTLDQVQAFLDGSAALTLAVAERPAAYAWMAETLRRFGYARLHRQARGLLLRYLAKVSGLSRQQVTRLVAQWRASGRITDRRGPPAAPFARRYTRADIALLAEVDALHGTLSGPATRKLCERAYRVFADARFERLAGISNGHLYNLRHGATYQRHRGTVTKTRPVQVAIGERRPPTPYGRPGYLRVDSVHQGDRDGLKGVYLINTVDAITQFQFVGAVERISERFLLPVLEQLLSDFPFPILGFHADNGSEYINHRVAPCSTSCRSASSPSRARAKPPTMPWSRARTAASCASTSAMPISPAASPAGSITSPVAFSHPTSTSTAPASSPPRWSTARVGSANATATTP